jgi:phage shock protein PspC (stress-responsive transcriptional regulator)
MNKNSDSQEKNETEKTQGNFFEAPGIPKSDFREESGIKYEREIDEKEIIRDSAFQERKEPKESDFKALEEFETGYENKLWAKSEKKTDEKAAEKIAETVQKPQKEFRDKKRTFYTMEERLTKSKTDRKLLGVCGGLGEYFGIDPTLIRLVFVALTLFDGIGLVIYIVMAIIIP